MVLTFLIRLDPSMAIGAITSLGEVAATMPSATGRFSLREHAPASGGDVASPRYLLDRCRDAMGQGYGSTELLLFGRPRVLVEWRDADWPFCPVC